MKKFKIGLCVFFIVALFSCDLPTQKPNNNNPDVSVGKVEEGASFFTEKGNNYIFELNDTRYLGGRGYTFWRITETKEEFEPFSVSMIKESGNINYGFGIIFNVTIDTEKETQSMLSVMLKPTGYYAIGKIENGVYTDIKYWTYSEAIKTGLGSKNIITISYNTETKNYELLINENEEKIIKFRDEKGGEKKGGGRGFVVTTSPQELFPNTSVKVTFTKEK